MKHIIHKKDSLKFKKAFNRLLLEHDFIKKGNTWYINSNEATGLVHLQASGYGDQFYVNLAVWFTALGKSPCPKEHHCPVRIRIDAAYPDEKSRFEKIFNLENDSMSDLERVADLSEIVNHRIVPMIHNLQDLNWIKKALAADKLSGAAVTLAAREFLMDRP